MQLVPFPSLESLGRICAAAAVLLGTAPACSQIPSFPVSVSPLHPNKIQLRIGESRVIDATITWLSEGVEASRLYQPDKFLSVAAGWENPCLDLSWPSAPPDRHDRFAARWEGYWRPAPKEYEFRIRADESARFYLNGVLVLSATRDPVGATASLMLDARTHHLGLDYLEETEDAFVVLEYREPGEAWKPIPATTGPQPSSRPGWNAVYTSRPATESEAILETWERHLDFNWGREGPFRRPVDQPTLRIRAAGAESLPLFELQSNRTGRVQIEFPPSSLVPGSTDATSFALTPSDSGPAVRFLFDRPGKWNPGSRLDVKLTPSEHFRIWVDGSGVESGSEVTQELDDVFLRESSGRPRLAGSWEALDLPLLARGRFWTLVAALQATPPPELSAARSGNTPAYREIYTRVLSELNEEVRRWAWLTAAGSIPVPSDRSADHPEVNPVLLDDLTADELTEFSKVLASQPGAASKLSQPPSLESIPTTTLVGLAETFQAHRLIEALLRRDDQGRLHWGGLDVESGSYRVSAWRLGSSKVDLQISESETRVDGPDAVWFRLTGQAQLLLSPIEVDREWEVDVKAVGSPALEVGPAARVEGARWNGAPLLLVRKGESLRVEKLPSLEGTLKIRFQRPGSKPRVPIPIR